MLKKCALILLRIGFSVGQLKKWKEISVSKNKNNKFLSVWVLFLHGVT